VILDLDDGRSLRYRDTRKFGRWSLVKDPATVLSRLGPEPLDKGFTATDFVRHLRPRRGKLKPLLLNQEVLAGLGNIYVDEALFSARLHPERSCATLSDAQLRVLYRSIREVLRRGIRTGGTTLGSGQGNFYSVAGRRGRNQDGLRVFRRNGEPCGRCGTTIARTIVGQRSTHLCPQCQPAP
jgi:formamidopyrimidine-DNA glycosylase